jgi:hypothetical protein
MCPSPIMMASLASIMVYSISYGTKWHLSEQQGISQTYMTKASISSSKVSNNVEQCLYKDLCHLCTPSGLILPFRRVRTM